MPTSQPSWLAAGTIMEISLGLEHCHKEVIFVGFHVTCASHSERRCKMLNLHIKGEAHPFISPLLRDIAQTSLLGS